MPFAAAIGRPESWDHPVKRGGNLPGQTALPTARAGDENGSQHDGPHGEVVDVPLQGFVLSAVAFDSCRQIPLGTPDVEVHARPEPESAQSADAEP